VRSAGEWESMDVRPDEPPRRHSLSPGDSGGFLQHNGIGQNVDISCTPTILTDKTMARENTELKRANEIALLDRPPAPVEVEQHRHDTMTEATSIPEAA
jgi:hypothetical protein